MVRISLFGRYQGSESEDAVLKNHWSSLGMPNDLNIRWLRSTDYKYGYTELTKCAEADVDPKHSSNGDELPEDVVFDATDSLHFKRIFKGLFPDRRTDLKILAITTADGKIVAFGVLHIEKNSMNHEGNKGIIGDLRIDKQFKINGLVAKAG